MGQEEEYLKRPQKNRRRSTKKSGGNRLLNVLIIVVALLIVISLVLIITNDDVKNEIKNPTPAEQLHASEEAGSGTGEDQSEQEDSSEQENVNGHEEEQQSSEATENQTEAGKQSITYYESTDPIVTLAWIDAEWAPYATEQTGPHTSKFDREHIDYQEKLKLLYRDTGLTEGTSIVWNVKNSDGDAIAVISSNDKQTIYRLSMQWVADTGWKTLLIEQLNSLEGAY